MKKKSPIRFQSQKAQGAWAELVFLSRAAALDFTVSTPYGDKAPYDAVVEKKGNVALVQIKSVTVRNGSRFQIRTWMRRDERPYRPDEADFYALYIVPLDLWYIVPVSYVATTNLYLRPEGPPLNHIEQFREAWHLLEKVGHHRRRPRTSKSR